MRRERGPDVRNRVEARPCSRGTRPVPIAIEFGLQGRMDILSSADVGPLLLAGLSLASLVTAFIGVFTGAAGGVIWLPQLGRIGAQRGRFAILGFGAVFLGVFVSATGTLLAPFIASAAPDRYSLAATMGALMTITHIAKLVAFGFIGFAIGSFVPLMAAMIVAGAHDHWIGELALHRTTERRFRLVFQLILTLLGLRLLWSAAPAMGWS